MLALRAVKDEVLLGAGVVLSRQVVDDLLPALIVGTFELRVAHADDAFDVEEVLVRVQPSQAAKQLALAEEPVQMLLNQWWRRQVQLNQTLAFLDLLRRTGPRVSELLSLVVEGS